MANSTSTDATRRAALAMLEAGAGTQSEVAALAGVSRQVIRYWARYAGIDCRAMRQARLDREWNLRLKVKTPVIPVAAE